MHPTAIVQPSLMLAVIFAAAATPAAATGQAKPAAAERPGFDNTPLLPDGFHVHGKARPRPPAVAPGPAGAPTPAPADAIVLFDGTNLDAWQGRRGAPAKWELVEDKDSGGAMQVNRTGDIRTRANFGDCQLHVEWMAPPPKGRGQGRGNSGVFFCGQYEVQVLDSFENPTYADGQAAAIYGQKPPLVNATRPPGQWNVYDIVFIAPRFHDDGTLHSPARLTVVHNGLVVQLDEELLGATLYKQLPKYTAHAPKGSIRLQDHGNPVRFRNIWVRPLQTQRPTAKKDAAKNNAPEHPHDAAGKHGG
ncbi:MAG: DUF1080 domain-containing protein [Planctomycetota bacterium]